MSDLLSFVGGLAGLVTILSMCASFFGRLRARRKKWQDELREDPTLRFRTALRSTVYLILGTGFFVVSMLIGIADHLLWALSKASDAESIRPPEWFYWGGLLLGLASTLIITAGMFLATALSSSTNEKP